MASLASRAVKVSNSSVIPPRVAKEISILFGAAANLSAINDRGLSKAIVYRIDTLAARYAMKRWPVTMERERLQEIHRFQNHLADSEKPFTPGLVKWSNGNTLLEADGVCWEISDWRPGSPIENLGDVDDNQIRQCAEALASIHSRSESYGTQAIIPPGLKQRFDGMVAAIRPQTVKRRRFLDSISAHNKYLAANVLNDIYLRAISVIPSVFEPVKRLSETSTKCFWILRDVWRQHLLFRENRLSGILDFGAARIDWPGLDFVRAFGTLMFESDPRWPIALEHYLNQRPDDSLVLTDLVAIHRASVALSALQWLDWFAEGQFDWTNRSSQVWNRILELQQQLEDFQKNEAAS